MWREGGGVQLKNIIQFSELLLYFHLCVGTKNVKFVVMECT